MWVDTLLQLLPISHISQLTGLHWHTIKAIDMRRLQASVGAFDPGNVRRLLPASAEPLAYLRAASDLEQSSQLDSAKRAYATALHAWPDQAAARFGLGYVS